MDILLLIFALPIAVITISIALQKILNCPPLVAGIVFSVFLVITFLNNDLNLLIVTIVYTIISYITAVLICIISKRNEEINISDEQIINNNCTYEQSYNCVNSNGVPTRINIVQNENSSNSCGCRQNRRNRV